jgi:hypothetical protein
MENTNPNSSANTILDASEKCGKFVSKVIVVILVILIVVLFGVGMHYSKKEDKKRLTTQATVTNASCYPKRKRGYNCVLNIKYIVKGVEYNKQLSSSDRMHQQNEIITISYIDTKPEEPIYNYMSNSQKGKYLLIASAITFVLLIIHGIAFIKSDWYKRIICIQALF